MYRHEKQGVEFEEHGQADWIQLEKGGVQDGKGKMTYGTYCSICHQPIVEESNTAYGSENNGKTYEHFECRDKEVTVDMKIEEIKTLLEAAKKILESIEKKVEEMG